VKETKARREGRMNRGKGKEREEREGKKEMNLKSYKDCCQDNIAKYPTFILYPVYFLKVNTASNISRRN
jgi:hypothetical protein